MTQALALQTSKAKARLGEVAEFINGSAFSAADWNTRGLPIIRIQNLNSATATYNFFSGPTDDKVMVDSGDLLISWSASLDAYLWARGPAVLNQHIFKVVEDKRKIRKDFLYWAVKSVMTRIRDQVHGGTMKHITKSKFEEIEIPLPPIHEQERIVLTLNEWMTKINMARAAAAAQLEATRALGRALSRQTFSPAATSQWTTTSLGEISEVSGGIQKTPDRAPREFHRPFLTVRNVQRGFLDLSVVERFEVTPGELARCRLERGDILIVEGNGSRNHIGRNAIFQGEPDDCIHQNHIIRVRVDHRVTSAEFVSVFLNSGRGAAQMLEKAKTTTGLYTLSVSKIEQLEIPLPPLDEQIRIIEQTRDVATSIEKVERAVRERLDAIEALPARFLVEAFLGHN